LKYPLFSVVIPTYNHAYFLKNAIQSLIDQEYNNWEALIVDNHSTDNTEELVKSFNDPRLSLHKIQNNGIIAASRNRGIDNAKGDWIAFLDSDDVWYPSKLKLHTTIIRSGEYYDVLSNDELMVDNINGVKTILRYGPVVNDYYKFLLIKGNRLSTSATLVKRSFLNKHSIRFRELEEYVTVEDYDFWLLLANQGAKFKFVNSVQGVYSIHSTNESLNNSRHKKNLMFLLQDHVFGIQTFSENKKALWRLVKAMLLFSDAVGLISKKYYLKAMKIFYEGIVISPFALCVYIHNRLEHKNYIKKLNEELGEQ
jgi:glycosyltransferase involved in cell wall biosynthesis